MILDFFFPTQCIICGKFGTYLCTKCQRHLRSTLPRCPECRTLSSHYAIHKSCKLKSHSPITQAITIWEYNKYSKRILSYYKYKGCERVGKYLAQLVSEKIRIDNQNSILIPIPSHYLKRYNRGYDHIKTFTKELSKMIDVEYYEGILKKVRATNPQVKLTYEQRKRNLLNAFQVQKHNQNIDQKEFILVDDVLTTGSTIKEAARTIHLYKREINIKAICIFQGANKEKVIK